MTDFFFIIFIIIIVFISSIMIYKFGKFLIQ